MGRRHATTGPGPLVTLANSRSLPPLRRLYGTATLPESMWNVLLLSFALALLTAGAELLVRGSASLARRLGLTPLVIGLTVVAFGTSAPEMVVSVAGVFQGHGDIALGNVVGSNIFNVGMILGLAALISPIDVKLSLLKLDAPFMVGVSIVALWLASLGRIPRWGGASLLLLLICYAAVSVRVARGQLDNVVSREFEEGVPHRMRSLRTELLLVLAGLATLVLASNMLVGTAVSIARSLGWSEAAIGLTIVAAGTSMPELATSVVAAVRRQPDIAVGNVIGSNIFNILGILGLAATLEPLVAPGVTRFDLWAMVIFAAALVPLLWTGRKLQRLEGLLLLSGYGTYLWVLWPE